MQRRITKIINTSSRDRVNWNKHKNAILLAEAVAKVKSKDMTQGQAQKEYGISESVLSKEITGARANSSGGVIFCLIIQTIYIYI